MLKRVCVQCSYMCLTDLEFQFAHHTKKHKLMTQRTTCDSAELEKRICPDGDFETHSQVALHRHVRTDHRPTRENRKSYECSHCDFAATCSKFLLLKHHDDVHRPKWHSCSECSYRTKHVTALRKHGRLKHGAAAAWICCAECSYRTRERSNFDKHVRKKHEAKRRRNTDRVNAFECDKCSYKAKQKFNLMRHIEAMHPQRVEQWYECGKCSYRARLRCRLNEHVKSHHDSRPEASKFKCDRCSYQTDKSSTFKTHRLQHMDASQVEWFTCAECSYRSLQKSNLNTHRSSKHAASNK